MGSTCVACIDYRSGPGVVYREDNRWLSISRFRTMLKLSVAGPHTCITANRSGR